MDVVNLDVLGEVERLKVFEKASESFRRLCVSTTFADLENTKQCSSKSSFTPHSILAAGIPVIPSNDELRKERVRIKRGNKKLLLSKLKTFFRKLTKA